MAAVSNQPTLTPPFGSWTQLGWRVGPDANAAHGTETTGTVNANVGANFLQYGNGVPYAPIVVANMNHSYLNLTDDVWTEDYNPSATGSWLSLITTANTPQFKAYYGRSWPLPTLGPGITGDANPSISANPANANGTVALQFLTPVVPMIHIVSSGSFTGFATVFGYDVYGQNVQKFVNISHVGATAGTSIPLTTAFYGMTGAYVQLTATGANLTDVKIQGTSLYGLPYKLTQDADAFFYNDNGKPLQGIASAPNQYLKSLVTTSPYTGVVVAGDSAVSTENSGDPRGTVTPVMAAPVTAGFTALGYWVRGADVLNTVFADQQRSGPNTPVTGAADVNGVVTYTPVTNTPMNVPDVYGNPQYWTGLVKDRS